MDFIARVEQLADDLNAVIDIINKRRAPGEAWHSKSIYDIKPATAAAACGRRRSEGSAARCPVHLPCSSSSPHPALPLPSPLAPGVAPLAPYAATSDNVNRQRCDPSESRLLASHYEAEMVGSIDTNKWVGLVAKEQYCSTAEFYQGRHAHCYAGVAEFYRSDLDVLLGAGRVK